MYLIYYIILYYITLYYITLYYIILYYITLYYIILYYIILYLLNIYYTIFRNIYIHYIYYGVLCYIILLYIILYIICFYLYIIYYICVLWIYWYIHICIYPIYTYGPDFLGACEATQDSRRTSLPLWHVSGSDKRSCSAWCYLHPGKKWRGHVSRLAVWPECDILPIRRICEVTLKYIIMNEDFMSKGQGPAFSWRFPTEFETSSNPSDPVIKPDAPRYRSMLPSCVQDATNIWQAQRTEKKSMDWMGQ